MSTPRVFRTGLVGAGYVSEFHIKALRRLPQVRVVGITDLDATRAREVAERFALPQAYPSLAAMAAAGLDVVHVLTPPHAHAAVALEALALGSDVLVEKPLATSVEDCDRLIAAAAHAGRRLGVNHSLLGDPQVVRGLTAVGAGAVGDVVAVDVFCSSVYPPYRGGPLPPQYRDGGYPFRDLGVHALYLLRALLGEIQGIRADYTRRGGDPNLCFDEWRATVRCERGSGQITLSWNVNPLQHFLVIHGTRGMLRIDLALMFTTRRRSLPLPKAAERVVNALADSLPPLWQVPVNALRFLTGRLQPYQGLHNFVRDFYAALASDAPLPASAEAGREVVRWAEEAARPADAAKAERAARYAASGKPAVLVTGASGFLGRHLVPRLLADGLRVRLFVRREPAADLINHPQVEVVLGDLGDPAAVDAAVRGATVVYHLGAAMRGGWEDHERGTIAGTRNVVEACLVHDVPKLVYVSSLSVIHWAGLDGGPPVTEEAPLEPHAQARGFYTQAKLRAEQLVAAAVREQRLRAVIVRPGQICGPDGPLAAATGALELPGRLLILGDGGAVLPLVDVDDVVDALQLAARSARFDGTIYHVVDEARVTQRELTEQLAAALGLRVWRLPQPVVMLLAAGLEALGKALKRRAPLTRYRLRSAQARLRFDCTKVRAELGWKPRTGVQVGLMRAPGVRPRAP